MKANIHLRIKDAGRRLDDADGLVVDLVGVERAGLVLNNGGNVEGKVLRVQLGREAVGQGLALASRDLYTVALGSKVADNGRWAWSTRDANRRHERASDKHQRHGCGLIVGNGQHSLRGMAIDKLDAKDLG